MKHTGSISHPRTHGGYRIGSGGKKRHQVGGPALEEILQDVCDVFGQPIEKMTMPGKKEEVVMCKRIYCYVATLLTDATFKVIGVLINKDHTTVMHHRASVIDWKSVNDSIFMKTWKKYTGNSKIWYEFENGIHTIK